MRDLASEPPPLVGQAFVSRGWVYSDGPMKAMDFQESYLRSILGFIGISDVYVVRVEGVAMGEAAVERAMASARERAGMVTQTLASGKKSGRQPAPETGEQLIGQP